MSRTRIRQIRSSDVTVCGAVLGDGPGEEYLEDHYASDHSAFPIPATTSARRFVYGRYIDEPVTMIDDTVSPAAKYYYHQNHRYDVVALTDSEGQIVEAYEYDPYGRHVLIEDGDTYPDADSKVNFNTTDTRTEWGVSSLGNPYTFTGRRYDGEVTTYFENTTIKRPSLHNFRNRYYSATRGRFISRDPIGIWGDGVNLGNGYAYVGGGVLVLVDPFGLGTQADGTYDPADGTVSQGSISLPSGYSPPDVTIAGASVFAGEMIVGFTPLGWMIDVKDFGVAYQEGSKIGMAAAGIGLFPFGDLVKAAVKYRKTFKTAEEAKKACEAACQGVKEGTSHASSKAAMRQAKRDNNIPTTSSFVKRTPNNTKEGFGWDYEFKDQDGKKFFLQNHTLCHLYPDGGYNPSHWNAHQPPGKPKDKMHYFYPMKPW